MITENDIKVGNVLKYLGGCKEYDLWFTVGDVYQVYEFNEGGLYIRDDDRDARYGGVFYRKHLWDILYSAP